MRVEVLVLGGEERLDHAPGNRLDGHEHPLLVRELGQQATVPSMHPGHGRWLIVGELPIVRQLAGVAMHQKQSTDAGGQPADDHPDRHDTEQLPTLRNKILFGPVARGPPLCSQDDPTPK